MVQTEHTNALHYVTFHPSDTSCLFYK